MPLFVAAFVAALLTSGVTAQAPTPATLIATGDLAFAQRRWADALAEYERALQLQPANASARVRAGLAALGLSRLEQAQSYFQSVVDAAPPSGAPLARVGLAMVAARQGRASVALEYLEAAVAAGYANHETFDAESGFDGIRRDPRFVKARGLAEARAYPCQADSTARAFDFWIGEWDVYLTGTAQKVGTNRIESIAHGCALLENWTASSGLLYGPVSDGTSMNFVDPATGRWKQVWMGSGRGQNNYVNGRYSDGAMRFEFARTDPQGNPVVGRFTFHDLGRNRVRQHQESSRDGGKTFQTVYDFTYIRRGSGERP